MNVMNKFLIYQNSKGEVSTFEVEPKYIKGNNFAVKNIETGRQKSFSMNLIIGLFDTQKEVDSALKKVELNKRATAKLEAQLERLETKVEKLRAKSEKIENQAERLTERADKKYESMERAQDKDNFERADELEKESDELSEKSTALEDEADELSEEADKIELEESEKLEEEIGKLDYDYFEQLASQTKAKIEALGLEVKLVIPRPKPTSMPEPQPQVANVLSPLPKTNNNTGLKIACFIVLAIIALVIIF